VADAAAVVVAYPTHPEAAEAHHDADGVRRICALRGGAGIFRGFRRRRLHRVGVLVLCVWLGQLWLLRLQGGQ
jgi:hypothetical protein